MTSNSNKTIISEQLGGGVVLHGYLTKLKTMRKKYFVLYEDCGKSLARLEYYDNEKKFKTKASPKRTIVLSSCFNINRRLDTKHDFAICLSTKDEGFGIVMDTEEDMDKWLKAMLKLQNGQNIFAGQPRPYYEHVWQVVVQRKGLAEKKGILGNYHVCLSSKSVTLIRIGSERTNIGETRAPLVEFYLTSIRRCGDSKCYFYMEVGRHSVVGAGELWMETKDSLIAQNMHTMILNVMSTSADDPYGPMRKRSSSATETSKPVTILQRRQTHSGSKTLNSSPSSVLNRDRCDSLPSSRNRTNTESGYNSFANTSMPPSRTMSSLTNVPNSVYNNRHSHSPPMNNNALSPSVGCSESDGSTLSIDEPDSMKHSLTPDDNSGFASRFYNSRSPGGVIPEENSDDFWCTENKKQNTIENALILDKLNIQTLSSSTNIHSEEPESQYMDMFSSISPCETAICDTNLAGGAEFPYKSCNDSSDGNSHASSLAEEVVDGYVHMSSPQTSDYVDMGQSLKSRRYLMNINSSSARIIASDIPLKDMCFAEYPIEKVNPRVLPDEDDMQHLKERPPRAYSVGSRMEHNNQKPRIDVVPITDQNNGRVRAFSVGSRSKVPRCDLQRNILMTNANASAANNANMNSSKISVASIEPTSESAVRGRKSCSAPLLIHKSQNSVDRMDDLMEIDFSKNSGSRSNSLSSQSAGSSSYLTNLPKGNHLRGSVLSNLSGLNGSSHNKSHDSVSEPIQVRAADNGYLEMRPVMYSHSIGSYDESLEHMSMPSQSSIPDLPEQSRTIAPELTPHNKFKLEDWNKIETPEGYLEMSWNGNKDNSYLNELPNTSAKSRSSSSTLSEIKKSRGVTKMPSLINNRTGISKLSVLQEQSQQREQLQNCNSAKTELTQRKRLFDQADTISEEKIPSTEYETPEKIHNQFLELSLRNNDDSSNARVSPATADTECSDYVNYSPGIPEQIPSPKKAEPAVVVPKEKPRDKERHPNLSNQSIETNCTESLDNYCLLNRNTTISTNPGDTTHPDDRSKSARKSNSPKSSNASSLRCHRLNNTNRQPTKPQGSGYELLHICSDSSLQTKKNISRPSSVNSDRIFPLESTQSRPSSVNSDCLQLNSVSSSAATLCFASSKNCDNRSQELALRPVPFSSSNNANHPDDNNKRTSTDSVSSKDILSAPLAQCPPLQSAALELHYASLDLPISSTKNSNTTIYGSANNPTRSATSDDTTTSLSPNSNTAQQSTFTYAKIDFNQCESKKYKCATQNNL